MPLTAQPSCHSQVPRGGRAMRNPFRGFFLGMCAWMRCIAEICCKREQSNRTQLDNHGEALQNTIVHI